MSALSSSSFSVRRRSHVATPEKIFLVQSLFSIVFDILHVYLLYCLTFRIVQTQSSQIRYVKLPCTEFSVLTRILTFYSLLLLGQRLCGGIRRIRAETHPTQFWLFLPTIQYLSRFRQIDTPIDRPFLFSFSHILFGIHIKCILIFCSITDANCVPILLCVITQAIFRNCFYFARLTIPFQTIVLCSRSVYRVLNKLQKKKIFKWNKLQKRINLILF